MKARKKIILDKPEPPHPFKRRVMGDGAASIREDMQDTMHDPAMDDVHRKEIEINAKKHPTEIRCPEQCLEFRRILEEMYRTHLDKNQDYSPYNIGATGEVGLTTRLWDKMARLMSLMGFNIHTGAYTGAQAAKGESVDDTLVDLGVYSIIHRIYRAGKWGK